MGRDVGSEQTELCWNDRQPPFFLTRPTCQSQMDWGSSPHYQHPHAGAEGHRAVTRVVWQREQRVWLNMNWLVKRPCLIFTRVRECSPLWKERASILVTILKLATRRVWHHKTEGGVGQLPNSGSPWGKRVWILPPRQHSTMSGDIFGCYDLRGLGYWHLL